ncbi:erythromycin esterase family protein [Terrimonas alba]|uniref:erythromycin esterase family protein n=1 Tax=Terrimonas alba TaxID=3349636 RepID=UPI0035F286E8
MKRIAFLSLFLLFVSLVFSQDTAKLDSQAIITWLQQKAIPIKHVEVGNGFSDLQPLKQILKDVMVVGLGENTHGTREFFQLKHRFLEFLVKEMNFTGFALEAGYGACEPINNYVLYGKGNLMSVLTAQGFVVWDMEEMAAMIECMRSYNQSVPDHKKVSFHGTDFTYNEAGREKVLAYLQKYCAQIAPAADSLFRLLSQQEKQWSKEKDKNLLANARVKLQDLVAYLIDHKDQLTTASSSKEFAQTVKYVQVMSQMFILHLPDSSDSSSTLNMKRSQMMGENLLYLMEKEKPNAKFVVWEHNVHIADGHMETAEPNLGHVLKKRLGDKYYAIAFEFNQGSYQSRLRSPGRFGDLKEATVTAAPKGYLAYYLSQAKKGNLFWNLRDSADNPTFKQWLRQPQKMRFFGWFNDDKSTMKVDLKSRYDGIIFIERATATRPTKSALATVARGEGL